MRSAPTSAVLLALSACSSAHVPASLPASAASNPASAPAAASMPSDFRPALTSTATITAPVLRAHVYTLADDQMEGRGPATNGIHRAADYLERHLIDMGLAPAFDQRYRQPFTMTVVIEIVGDPKLVQNGRPLTFGRDFAPFAFSGSGVFEGSLAFAGYGIRAEEYDYDDYAGLDVTDKIVVVLQGEPGDEDPKSPFDGKRTTKHAALRTKVLLAREAGAKALLVIRKKKLDDRRHFEPVSDAGIVALRLSGAAGKKLLGFDPAKLGRQIDETYRPASKPTTRRTSFDVKLERRTKTVENVGAVLRGEGATEAVVIGAHYDHLGMGGGSDSLSGTTEPTVHNGADDNASGTAVVLEVARALHAMGPAKRDVYFFLFAGEEAGLLGSSHLMKNAPFDATNVAAMINLDMVGRMRRNTLNVMGTKTAGDWRSFVEQAVAARGLKGTFGGDGYGPSDHTSFYSAGIPVLFLFTGAHSDYHKPSDDPDTLDYQGMAKVAAVAADLLRGVADADGRPRYVHAPAPKPMAGAGRGYGPYFGSIPDFGEGVNGVLLSGVRKGSPADAAGVRKGDIIVSFGGMTVTNLRDFTIALRRSAPGDEVTVKVKRGEAVHEMKATLTKRGE